MGRSRRTQVGGLVYHALNRANGRSHIFADGGDYAVFVRVALHGSLTAAEKALAQSPVGVAKVRDYHRR
jgi:hypothetical protein